MVVDDGMKVGCKTLTTIRQIPVPKIPAEQRVEIAIRCVLLVYKEEAWVKWANDWLSGKDRTLGAARAAEAAARAAEAAVRAAEAAVRAAAEREWQVEHLLEILNES